MRQRWAAMAGFKKLEEIEQKDIHATGVSHDDAARIFDDLQSILSETDGDQVETWRRVAVEILRPDHPFALHKSMFFGCYCDFSSDAPPAWVPDRESALLTNVGRLLQKHGEDFLGSGYKDPVSSFLEFQKFSVSNPEVYWTTLLDEMEISFSKRPSCIVRENDAYPGGEWLPGAMLNAAENCLLLNSKKKDDDFAIIWRNEGFDSGELNHMTLKELRSEVGMVVEALQTLGLTKGTSIAIDMPMTATAVVIYLAIISAGFVVVSIADSFAPMEISTRLKISDAKAIFTQDYIIRGEKNIPLYIRVIDADAPPAVVVPTKGSSFSRELRECDISWHAFLERAKETKCGIRSYTAIDAPVEAFTNILFSSGTTGEPKAIPWTHATPLKASADAWIHMDIRKGDVVAWPTNLGWMMGPWLVYSTLINGASMALYNGSPLGHGFAKFVQDAKVTMLGVVPSIVRSWKNTNCTAGIDWSSIRCFSSTGEASSMEEYLWLMGRAGYKPVIEYCGGTEIGGAFVTGSLVQPQSLSSFSTPAMGCTLLILDRDGKPLPGDEPGIGEVALFPTMLGASTTLLNGDHYGVYFRGMPVWNGKILRRHGDELEKTSSGYFRAHGRADDTMNLGGIKVSSVEIERVCNAVSGDILETAAIGVPPPGGGADHLVVVIVFTKHRHSESEDSLTHLKSAFNAALQTKLNPLFRVSSVVAVPSLPRTATNKVMRRLLKQQLQQSGLNFAKL